MAAASFAIPLAEAMVPALGDSAILNSLLFTTPSFASMPDSGTMSNRGGGFSETQLFSDMFWPYLIYYTHYGFKAKGAIQNFWENVEHPFVCMSGCGLCVKITRLWGPWKL